jgi:crotonobetainyl-CoA:carnitine CoA-transferase CaiB-like acyl-CoA transferase
MNGPSVDVFGGVRVVELVEWVFVPVAGALLADWGAEVVKIEPIHDRQVAANGCIGEVPVDGGRSYRLPVGAVQFDEQPAAMRRGPENGQDTEAIP